VNLVGAIVLVLPEDLAVHPVQAQHALRPGQAVLSRCFDAAGRFVALAVHDVDTLSGHAGTGETTANLGPPEDGGAAGRELVEDPRLAPDAVALRAEPLRPIVGQGARRYDRRKEAKQKQTAQEARHETNSSKKRPSSRGKLHR